MKIDFSRAIADLDGNPLRRPDGKGDMTVGEAAMQALLTAMETDKGGDGLDGFNRFQLASRIHASMKDVGSPCCEISIEEAKTIKERVAKAYAPLVQGRVWQALEGVPAAKDKCGVTGSH